MDNKLAFPISGRKLRAANCLTLTRKRHDRAVLCGHSFEEYMGKLTVGYVGLHVPLFSLH